MLSAALGKARMDCVEAMETTEDTDGKLRKLGSETKLTNDG